MEGMGSDNRPKLSEGEKTPMIATQRKVVERCSNDQAVPGRGTTGPAEKKRGPCEGGCGEKALPVPSGRRDEELREH